MAAGTYDVILSKRGGNVLTLQIDWTSNAAGAVTQTNAEAITAEVPKLRGLLLRVIVIPDSGGTQPDDLFDMTLLDANGIDMLAGNGANLSNSQNTAITINQTPFYSEVLRPQITGAGDSNGGAVLMYYQRAD